MEAFQAFFSVYDSVQLQCKCPTISIFTFYFQRNSLSQTLQMFSGVLYFFAYLYSTFNNLIITQENLKKVS